MMRRRLSALTLSLILTTAFAQGWNSTPSGAAATSSAAASSATSSTLPPISLTMLPYGTVQLGPTTYMISNYLGTGTNVMVYAQAPLHVATYDEMMLFQAQYAQAMTRLATAPIVTATPKATAPVATQPAPINWTDASSQVQSSAPVWNTATAVPAMTPPAAAVPPVPAIVTGAPTQPVKIPAAMIVPAPQTPVAVLVTTPVPPVVEATPKPATSTGPVSMPPVPSSPPAQPLPTPVAVTAPTAAGPVVPATSVAAQPRDPQATTLPDFLHGTFTARTLSDGRTQISYSIVNRSHVTTAKLDPQHLRVNQGGTYLAARLDARDSSGEPMMLPPNSGEIGTITFRNVTGTQTTPVTLEWTVQDLTNNVSYPVRYRWTPSATTAVLKPGL